MAEIITRVLEATAINQELTIAQVDQNLINLKEAVDALEEQKLQIEIAISGESSG